MKLWDQIYMDWNGEKILGDIAMDETDHKVLIFEKKVDANIDIKPKIMKESDGRVEVMKEIQELHLKKGDTIKYEFKIHLVAE